MGPSLVQLDRHEVPGPAGTRRMQYFRRHDGGRDTTVSAARLELHGGADARGRVDVTDLVPHALQAPVRRCLPAQWQVHGAEITQCCPVVTACLRSSIHCRWRAATIEMATRCNRLRLPLYLQHRLRCLKPRPASINLQRQVRPCGCKYPKLQP